MFTRLFVFMWLFLILQVNNKVNRSVFAGKKEIMASIYPDRKDGKIVSFKFKAFL